VDRKLREIQIILHKSEQDYFVTFRQSAMAPRQV